MKQKFFTIADNFEGIIKTALCDVVLIEKIPTGWTNFVFRVNTKNCSHIFRFPRNDFWVERLERELAFAEAIRTNKNFNHIKTPKYITGEDAGRKFSIHKMIDGVPLSSVMDKMTPEQMRLIATDIASYMVLLSKLEKMPVKCETATQFLQQLEQVNGKGYGSGALERLKQLDAENVQVHGDLNPGNILVDKNFRMVGVLDYAFTPRSTPLTDLGWLVYRMPNSFRDIMVAEFERAFVRRVEKTDLDYLVGLWEKVAIDYIDYMKRCHPDIILPS